MKLKKILAIALAATTALTMVPANVAEAAHNELHGAIAEGGETFSWTDSAVGTRVSNGGYTPTGTESAAVITYTFKIDSATDNTANVILTGYTSDKAITEITVPTTGANQAAGTIKTDDLVNAIKDAGFRTPKADDFTNVNVIGVELNADDFDEASKIGKVDLHYLPATTKKIVLKNFSAADANKTLSLGVTSGVDVAVKAAPLETIDFSGSGVFYNDTNAAAQNNVATLIRGGNATASLSTLKLGSLCGVDETANATVASSTTDASFATYPKLEDVDFSGNAGITKVTLAPALVVGKPAIVNISEMDALNDLQVTGNTPNTADASGKANAIGALYQGVKFITNGGTDAAYDLDLGNYKMKNVVVNKVLLNKFTAPMIADLNGSNNGTDDDALTIDISNNFVTDMDVSGSGATSIVASNNKLMDVDVSGLSKLATLTLDNNFLTSLDVKDCATGISLSAKNNFIKKDNFDKDSKQTGASIGTQKSLTVSFSVMGDAGLATGSSNKAYVKNGGSATILAAIGIMGAPEGFADRLISTLKWTESNDKGGAVTIGTADSKKIEEYKPEILGYQTLAISLLPITGADARTATEKLTLAYGGGSTDFNVASDDIAIVTYDVTTNIDSENVKTSGAFKNQVNFAMFDYPQTAAVLSNGSAKITTVASPQTNLGQALLDGAKDTLVEDVAKASIEVGTEKEGYKFKEYNTAQTGDGTAYQAKKSITVSEDTTLYAIYTPMTYNVSFSKNGANSGSMDPIKGVNYGSDVTLTTNAYTKNSHTFEGWVKDDANYADGATVYGLATSGTASLDALWANNDMYVSTKDNTTTIDLVYGDQANYAYRLGALDPTVRDGNSLKAGQYGNAKDVESAVKGSVDKYYTSNSDVVAIINRTGYPAMIYAKGEGTATVYLYDSTDKALATVTVNVTTAAKNAADELEKKEQQAAVNAIEANEKVDVSKYSGAAKVVKKNGEGTVTVVEGQNKKTVNLATKIQIGDKSYTITKVAANAYKGSSKLTTLSTGNKVTYIGKNAFANCKKLSKLTLGTKVASIKSGAFSGTVKLKTVVVKTKKLTTTKKVAANAFKNAGKKVKTTVNFKSITKNVAKKERTVLKKRGLKTYGKKTTTYKRNGKKF